MQNRQSYAMQPSQKVNYSYILIPNGEDKKRLNSTSARVRSSFCWLFCFRFFSFRWFSVLFPLLHPSASLLIPLCSVSIYTSVHVYACISPLDVCEMGQSDHYTVSLVNSVIPLGKGLEGPGSSNWTFFSEWADILFSSLTKDCPQKALKFLPRWVSPAIRARAKNGLVLAWYTWKHISPVSKSWALFVPRSLWRLLEMQPPFLRCSTGWW